MNKSNTITIQEVRHDLGGFLERLAKGETLTVIARSKPVVTVTTADKSKQVKTMAVLLEVMARARRQGVPVGHSEENYKDIYSRSIGTKHGVS